MGIGGISIWQLIILLFLALIIAVPVFVFSISKRNKNTFSQNNSVYTPSERDDSLLENSNITASNDNPAPRKKEGFKNPQILTKWVRNILYIQLAVAVVSIVSGYMEYQLLSDYQNGVYTSQEQAVADGEANDKRQRVISIVYTLVFIVSGILILIWIYRANYNARQLGAEGMTFTPGWSVGWYFIPIAMLWKPYQAMKEIWRASHFSGSWKHSNATALLPWWWWLWLANGFLGQAVLHISLRAEEIDELMNANLVYQASDIASIPLTLVTLTLINSIFSAQMDQSKSTIGGNLTMFCPSCGVEVDKQAKFCKDCGASTRSPDAENPNHASQSAPLQQQTSGFAISSMILGILGIVIGWIILTIPSILAVIFGHVARGKIRRSGGAITGDGMALAGLIMGYSVITIAGIGILAAISTPAYQEYTVRAKIHGVDNSIRAAVTTYVGRTNQLPLSKSELGLTLDASSREIVSSINIDSSGRITVTFASPSQIEGQTIVYEPNKGQSIVERWDCTGGTINTKYRPIKCRK